jgi:hypothetical protein
MYRGYYGTAPERPADIPEGFSTELPCRSKVEVINYAWLLSEIGAAHNSMAKVGFARVGISLCASSTSKTLTQRTALRERRLIFILFIFL